MKHMKSLDRLALATLIAAATLIPLAHAAYAGDDAPKAHAAPRVLTDAVFDALPYGATQSQVLEALGAPASKEEFRRTRTVAWDYPYRDTWGYDASFAAIFDDHGVMVGKFSSRIGG